MIDHVLASVVAAPVATTAACHVLVDRMPPGAATKAVTAAACLAAVASSVSLAVAAAPGVLWLAQALTRGETSGAVWAGAAQRCWPYWLCATACLAVAAAASGTVRRQRLALKTARCEAAGLPGDGDVAVVPGPVPEAFALPGSPGRVVVTEGMLAALPSDQARAALLAHERAHLALRHHRFAFAARLAGAAQPLLRPAAAVAEYAIERWADEQAAVVVGDRDGTARAVGAAALVAHAAPRACSPAVLGAVTSTARSPRPGPVPRRVAALLRPPVSPGPRVLLAALAATPLALAGASLGLTVEAFFDIRLPYHR